MSNSYRFAKLSLFIFGSSAFGWVLGTGLHELGHAVSMWITCGVVDRISLVPFSWSYTYYGSTPKYPQFTTWSGALLGSFFGLLILFLIRNIKTPYIVPFLYLGIAPMLHGGGYYLIDTFVTKHGDAASLIQAGVPIYLVLGVAFILSLLGVYFLIKYFYRNGISPKSSFLHRVMVLGFGLTLYYVLALIYSVLFEPENIVQFIIAIVLIILGAFFFSFVSMKFPRIEKYKLSSNVEWRHVAYSVTLGILTIVVPHLLFAS